MVKKVLGSLGAWSPDDGERDGQNITGYPGGTDGLVGIGTDGALAGMGGITGLLSNIGWGSVVDSTDGWNYIELGTVDAVISKLGGNPLTDSLSLANGGQVTIDESKTTFKTPATLGDPGVKELVIAYTEQATRIVIKGGTVYLAEFWPATATYYGKSTTGERDEAKFVFDYQMKLVKANGSIETVDCTSNLKIVGTGGDCGQVLPRDYPPSDVPEDPTPTGTSRFEAFTDALGTGTATIQNGDISAINLTKNGSAFNIINQGYDVTINDADQDENGVVSSEAISSNAKAGLNPQPVNAVEDGSVEIFEGALIKNTDKWDIPAGAGVFKVVNDKISVDAEALNMFLEEYGISKTGQFSLIVRYNATGISGDTDKSTDNTLVASGQEDGVNLTGLSGDKAPGALMSFQFNISNSGSFVASDNTFTGMRASMENGRFVTIKHNNINLGDKTFNIIDDSSSSTSSGADKDTFNGSSVTGSDAVDESTMKVIGGYFNGIPIDVSDAVKIFTLNTSGELSVSMDELNNLMDKSSDYSLANSEGLELVARVNMMGQNSGIFDFSDTKFVFAPGSITIGDGSNPGSLFKAADDITEGTIYVSDLGNISGNGYTGADGRVYNITDNDGYYTQNGVGAADTDNFGNATVSPSGSSFSALYVYVNNSLKIQLTAGTVTGDDLIGMIARASDGHNVEITEDGLKYLLDHAAVKSAIEVAHQNGQDASLKVRLFAKSFDDVDNDLTYDSNEKIASDQGAKSDFIFNIVEGSAPNSSFSTGILSSLFDMMNDGSSSADPLPVIPDTSYMITDSSKAGSAASDVDIVMVTDTSDAFKGDGSVDVSQITADAALFKLVSSDGSKLTMGAPAKLALNVTNQYGVLQQQLTKGVDFDFVNGAFSLKAAGLSKVQASITAGNTATISTMTDMSAISVSGSDLFNFKINLVPAAPVINIPVDDSSSYNYGVSLPNVTINDSAAFGTDDDSLMALLNMGMAQTAQAIQPAISGIASQTSVPVSGVTSGALTGSTSLPNTLTGVSGTGTLGMVTNTGSTTSATSTGTSTAQSGTTNVMSLQAVANSVASIVNALSSGTTNSGMMAASTVSPFGLSNFTDAPANIPDNDFMNITDPVFATGLLNSAGAIQANALVAGSPFVTLKANQGVDLTDVFLFLPQIKLVSAVGGSTALATLIPDADYTYSFNAASDQVSLILKASGITKITNALTSSPSGVNTTFAFDVAAGTPNGSPNGNPSPDIIIGNLAFVPGVVTPPPPPPTTPPTNPNPTPPGGTTSPAPANGLLAQNRESTIYWEERASIDDGDQDKMDKVKLKATYDHNVLFERNLNYNDTGKFYGFNVTNLSNSKIAEFTIPGEKLSSFSTIYPTIELYTVPGQNIGSNLIKGADYTIGVDANGVGYFAITDAGKDKLAKLINLHGELITKIAFIGNDAAGQNDHFVWYSTFSNGVPAGNGTGATPITDDKTSVVVTDDSTSVSTSSVDDSLITSTTGSTGQDDDKPSDDSSVGISSADIDNITGMINDLQVMIDNLVNTATNLAKLGIDSDTVKILTDTFMSAITAKITALTDALDNVLGATDDNSSVAIANITGGDDAVVVNNDDVVSTLPVDDTGAVSDYAVQVDDSALHNTNADLFHF